MSEFTGRYSDDIAKRPDGHSMSTFFPELELETTDVSIDDATSMTTSVPGGHKQVIEGSDVSGAYAEELGTEIIYPRMQERFGNDEITETGIKE